MIDRKRLLDDLRKLVTKLEKDLSERCEENAEIDARVRLEYDQAKEAKRTAQAYKIWRDEWITQVAVAWVLGAVFVRFIEDNELIATPFIAGPGQRLDFAKEQRTAFFTRNPTLSDREYLEHVFREVAKLPAMKELYDERHNPLWSLGVSGDGAKLILEQFQKTDVTTGALVHDFTDPVWETRFLGDLYQDLSESARKKYALLQTPDFVEKFILDRTLDPAIAEFGLAEVRMIDPTCGSGHFLLGAFTRIFRLWEAREPATNPTALAQRALDSVYGVDLNPFAVAISRFRLLVAAMQASGVERLADAPAFAIHVAVGDSLLHGPRFSATVGVQRHLDPAEDPLRHVYATEDADALRQILGQQYHAVVGNPPYIIVRDRFLNQAYRDRYSTCFRKYQLVAPFFERFFDLAVDRGWVGLIASNAFMKREFGRKLVTAFFPHVDLTHVIDTAGAYIPDHGTPTGIFFGRKCSPLGESIRVVRGIRGEPGTPSDPAEGLVWRAILAQVDVPASVSEFVSADDVERKVLSKHPWPMGGGGAAELKEVLDEAGSRQLKDVVQSIGPAVIFGEDDAFIYPVGSTGIESVPREFVRPLVDGDAVRDWRSVAESDALFPYDSALHLASHPAVLKVLWRNRTLLWNRADFGQMTYLQSGRNWYEYHQMPKEKQASDAAITFADVATHNHFVFEKEPKLYNRHAPIIKLPRDASEQEYFELLGPLNSAVGCFWLKQVCHSKGAGGGTRVKAGRSPLGDERWENHFEFSGRTMLQFPLADQTAAQLSRLLVATAQELKRCSPSEVLARDIPEREQWAALSARAEQLVGRMIALQEELDWATYENYGLASDLSGGDVDVPAINLGERPFEILLARDIAAGKTSSAWFSRHGSRATTDLPSDWPDSYRALVNRRIDAISSNEDLRLIEQPEYKRRWNIDTWETQSDDALRRWLVTRLESERYWTGAILPLNRLASAARVDADFMKVAELFRRASEFDVASLVEELLLVQTVPALPSDLYKPAGLESRRAWEETWYLQRRQDRGELVADIPVPPKYNSASFRSTIYWSLRGKLDVPKERFISFPGCERESDSSLPILWAGYDHLQQAKAIAAYYQDLKEKEGAGPAKLGKLLACILELLPWLKQWHNEVDPEYGTRMGDFFETFMLSEMSSLGLSMEELRKIRGL